MREPKIEPKTEVVYEFHPESSPRFQVGDVVRGQRSSFRAVVIDVHPRYTGAEDWYERLSGPVPSKSQPWYEILVHDSQRLSYVAEDALEADYSGLPVSHPMVRIYFNEFDAGRYRVGGLVN
jgi:heat shock protein HspQ